MENNKDNDHDDNDDIDIPLFTKSIWFKIDNSIK